MATQVDSLEAGSVALALMAHLMGALHQKGIMSSDEIHAVVVKTANDYADGVGPANVAARQMLRAIVPSAPI